MESVIFSTSDCAFMQQALQQARCALERNEVPVGCVIVRGNEVISKGHNQTNMTKNGTRHAEMIAIDTLLSRCNGDLEAADFGSCILYVTCEPCIMCAGVLSLLQFQSVVYGCPNERFGGNGSILSIHETGCGVCCPGITSKGGRYLSAGGLYKEEAIQLLQDFYIRGNPNAPKPHRPLQSRDGTAIEEQKCL